MLTIIHFSSLGIAALFVPTLGVDLLVFHESRVSCLIYCQSSLYFVTVGVCWPKSCRMSVPGYYWLHLSFDFDPRRLRFPTSCPVAPENHPC